jgi:membrane fusion protein (multidrug efflux system)
MYKYFSVTCLVLALAISETGCSGNDSAVAAVTPSTSTVSTPSNLPVAPTEELTTISGPLIVEHQVDLAAQRDGVVAKIMVEPGRRMSAGEVLALLDDRQILAELDAARAKTRSIEADLNTWIAEARVLQSDYDRAQKMWNAKLITKEQLDHAQFKAEADQWDVKRVRELLTNAQATQRSLELELEKTRIRMPFNGLVARRYLRDGQQVAKGDRLFWVTAEGPLRMRVTLPEKFLGRLRKGERLMLTLPDVPGENYPAKVVEVSPVVDASSGTVEVVVELIGTRSQLHPGMTANLHIDKP